MPNLKFLKICDYAGPDDTDPRKLSIIRIFETLELPEIPYPEEHFSIVAEWVGNPGEQFIQAVAFIPPTGTERRVLHDERIVIPQNGYALTIQTFYRQGIFSVEGDHRIGILANGTAAERGILVPVRKAVHH